LKIKCVFNGISERCARCTRGRAECIIRGKKKLTKPEHLAKIDDLMRKLEHASMRAAAAAAEVTSPTTSRRAALSANDAFPPVLSPSMEAAAACPRSSDEVSSEH